MASIFYNNRSTPRLYTGKMYGSTPLSYGHNPSTTHDHRLFMGNEGRVEQLIMVVVVDNNYHSHIQRIVLVTEETAVTQQVSSHRPMKCQSRSWSQRRTNVNNGSNYGYTPLLEPTGIQIATKLLPGSTNQEHRKLIGVKTMSSLGTSYSSFYCRVVMSAASISGCI